LRGRGRREGVADRVRFARFARRVARAGRAPHRPGARQAELLLRVPPPDLRARARVAQGGGGQVASPGKQAFTARSLPCLICWYFSQKSASMRWPVLPFGNARR